MWYDSNYSGKYYQLKGGEVYTLRADGKYAYAGALTGATTSVQLTGYYGKGADGNNMYQTTSGGYIRIADGWQYTAYAPIKQYKQKDAQKLVDEIIKNNAHVLENNLFCARFANKLTDDQRWKLFELQQRLESRNEKLLKDGFCVNQKVSVPPGYADLQGYLSSFMAGETIASATITLVVVAIVLASLSVAAYYAYKNLASESEKDVKYSDELTKILMDKLTDEEYQQLMQETQGIVTKSKLVSKLGSGLSWMKWVLLGAAGLALYNAFKND